MAGCVAKLCLVAPFLFGLFLYLICVVAWDVQLLAAGEESVMGWDACAKLGIHTNSLTLLRPSFQVYLAKWRETLVAAKILMDTGVSAC